MNQKNVSDVLLEVDSYLIWSEWPMILVRIQKVIYYLDWKLFLKLEDFYAIALLIILLRRSIFATVVFPRQVNCIKFNTPVRSCYCLSFA